MKPSGARFDRPDADARTIEPSSVGTVNDPNRVARFLAADCVVDERRRDAVAMIAWWERRQHAFAGDDRRSWHGARREIGRRSWRDAGAA